MEKIYQVEHIINRIKSVQNGKHSKKGVCFFLGAGADITSGGKLFRDLKKEFIQMDGKAIIDSISDEKLDELFEDSLEKLSDNGRCETLEYIMRENKKPSEGYQLMLLLANAGIINNIITTNFDLLLEESEELLGIEPFRVFAPGLASPEGEYLRRNQSKPSYIKLHGDLNARIVTHLTLDELNNLDYAEAFSNYIKHIINNNIIIFVGYGGFDPLVTNLFKEESSELDECFWCNPKEPKDNSELVDFLISQNKLLYVNIKFDDLFILLSKYFFSDKDLPNANFIFFDSIIRSKSEKLISDYMSTYNKEYIIRRENLSYEIEDFLANNEYKMLLVSGQSGLGKTCLLQKSLNDTRNDFVWFPISSLTNLSVSHELSSAIGYSKTEVPFSLLYTFSAWCYKNKKNIVFVIDDINKDKSSKKLSIKYDNEFMTLIRATRPFYCVKFIVALTENECNLLNDYDDSLIKKIKVTKFNDNELNMILTARKILDKNIENDLKEILKEPYIWHIMDKNNINLLDNQTGTFFDFLLEHISASSASFSAYSLKVFLQKKAYYQVFNIDESYKKNDAINKLLLNAHIIDENGNIGNNLVLNYFCMSYILNKYNNIDIIITKYILPYCYDEVICDTNSKFLIFVDLLSNIENINDVEINISSIDNAMKTNISIIKSLQHITILVLEKMIVQTTEVFEEYLYETDLSVLSIHMLNCLIKVISQLRPEWCYVFLDNTIQEISFEAFITISDFQFINTYNTCKLPKRLQFLFTIYQLSYWGWDNTLSNNYDDLCIEWKNLVSQISLVTGQELSTDVGIIKKHAYNIFFNSGNDIDEKYHVASCNQTILYLKDKLFSTKEALSANDLKELIYSDDVYSNSCFFIFANVLVIYSMRCNFEKTLLAIKTVYEMEWFDVENIDFYLSCVFWSLYIFKPNDREIFVNIFKKVISKYEIKMFDYPIHKRESTSQKFREQFECEFEDGFNPLAFYFYTAPYNSNVLNDHEWNNGKFDLSIYWDLVNDLHTSGNYGNMLRIVHALGQMISIYPEEGLMSLEHIKPYLSEPVIKRGVVRILKESYIRNFKKTESWLETCGELNDEVQSIRYNTKLYVNNRTFEQLHWARIFYNLEKIYDIQLDVCILSNLKNPSFNRFLENILREIGICLKIIKK